MRVFHAYLPAVALIYSSAIANQESLSGLETEMRKLEGIVKEISEEMTYLKRREERFTDTNCTFPSSHSFVLVLKFISINQPPCAELCLVFYRFTHSLGRMANISSPRVLQTKVPY